MSRSAIAIGLVCGTWVAAWCVAILLSLFEFSWYPITLQTQVGVLTSPAYFAAAIVVPTLVCLVIQLRGLQRVLAE